MYPALAGLGASKAALLHLANSLNAELKPKCEPLGVESAACLCVLTWPRFSRAEIHVATVTVCGYVGGDDPKYSKENIGPHYVKAFELGLDGEAEAVY